MERNPRSKEGDCTGWFWVGRYKCQALLDEQAILSCMAYVDLNPIRAAMAATPEESDYTSIKQRIKHFAQFAQTSPINRKAPSQPTDLFPFVGNPRQPMPVGLAYSLTDYLELVDWTGRRIRDDKRGSINAGQPPILSRLNISPQHWVYLCTEFESRFKGLVGRVETVKQAGVSFGLKAVRKDKESMLLFG